MARNYKGKEKRHPPEVTIDDVIKKTALITIREVLTSIGFDIENPIEMQKDVASMRHLRDYFDSEEGKADLAHSRSSRIACETIKKQGLIVSIGIVTVAMVGYLFSGMIEAVRKALGGG